MLGRYLSKPLRTTKAAGIAQAAAVSVVELRADSLAACGASTNVCRQSTDVEEDKLTTSTVVDYIHG